MPVASGSSPPPPLCPPDAGGPWGRCGRVASFRGTSGRDQPWAVGDAPVRWGKGPRSPRRRVQVAVTGSWGRCNKGPQSPWLQTAHMCELTALGPDICTGILVPSGPAPSGRSRENLFLFSLPRHVAPCCTPKPEPGFSPPLSDAEPGSASKSPLRPFITP